MADQICELWLQIIERLGDIFGRPIPKRLLKVGDADEGWFVEFNAERNTVNGVAPY